MTDIAHSFNLYNELTEGTILAAKTSQGRYSKFVAQEYGYTLIIASIMPLKGARCRGRAWYRRDASNSGRIPQPPLVGIEWT
ncbi:MAG: hypothetical protein ACQESR_25035 [Planctomycetota bacterium]